MSEAACLHEPYPQSGEGVSTEGYTLVRYLCCKCQEWVRPGETR